MSILGKIMKKKQPNKSIGNKKYIKKQSEKEKKENILTGSSIKDVVAPSCVREVMPHDQTIEGKANNYYVEVGTSTGEMARYFRAFYAAFTGIYTYYGMLSRLYDGNYGKGDCDVVVRINPADRSAVMMELSRKIAGIESDMINEKDKNKITAMLQEVEDLKSQQERLRLELEKLFRVSVIASMSGNNLEELNQNVNLMSKSLEGSSIYMRACDTWQLDAVMGTTPLGKKPLQVACRNMETSNVAHMFPFGTGGLSFKDGILLGLDNHGKPVFVNLWGLNAYNAVILGRTGSGKSYAAKRIIDLLTLEGGRVAIIDPEQEFLPLVKARGCPYISLTAEGEDRINLFDVEEEEEEDGSKTVNIEETITGIMPIIFKMVRNIDENFLTGQVKLLLQEKMYELYQQFEITEDVESLYEPASNKEGVIDLSRSKRKKRMPMLIDYYNLIKQDSELENVAQCIRAYTREGRSKSQAIFDCETNVDMRHAPMIGLSVKGLGEMMKPIAMYVVTNWLQRKFVFKNPKQKKMVVIDEAQVPMQDPEMSKWVGNAFRMSRKRNTSMVAITQGFNVLLQTVDGEAIMEQSPFKFILKQSDTDVQSVKGRLNLTDGELGFILTAGTGECIIKAGDESVKCSVMADKESDQLYNTDPNRYQEKENIEKQGAS